MSLSETKPAELFRKLTSRFGHMPLDGILSGKNLTPCEIRIKGNLSKSTFHHVINRPSNYGLVGKREGKYFLVERYSLFHEFAEEFYELQNSIKASKFSGDSDLIWSGVGEFILSTREYKGKDVGNFHLTGLERFSDFGLELIGTGAVSLLLS